MKTIALLNLINHEPDIAKTFTYAKDPYKAKYQLLINKKESKGLKQLNDSKVFIQYWNDMDDICKIIEYHNTNKKQKVMIVFDDMVADIFSNKEPNPTVTELVITGRKLNISIVFIRQAYFGVPKNIRLNSTHIFVMTIPSKRKIQQIAFNHSLDIDLQDVMRPCKKCTTKSYSFFIIDTTLASDNSTHFRNNL